MSVDNLAMEGAVRPRSAARSRFFLGMTLAMAAVVLIGFGPTLFGRAFFDVPPMPGYLFLHGILIAGWYALLATQALLAGKGSLALHRRLGWVALAFVVLIPVAGMGVQLALPARLEAAGLLEALRPLVENIFWLNLAAVTQFVGFVIAALVLRTRAESHKRLMLFAGIAIIQPAAARLSRWPVFGNTAPDLSQPASTGGDVLFAVSCVLLLAGLIAVHDLLRRRRLHRVTVVGLLVLLGSGIATRFIITSTWGREIVWAMS